MDYSNVVYFVDKNFHSEKLTRRLQSFKDIPKEPGTFLEDGRINLDCPCLHSNLAHRCGHFLREAIQCTNKSTSKPRGEECIELFMEHELCLKKFDTAN